MAFRRLTRELPSLLAVTLTLAAAALPAHTPLPNAPDSVKFAVIGDNGTGDRPQYDVGERMAAIHATFPFDLVLMLGDNMYGRQRPEDFVTKFERPYQALLSNGVVFRAALGNHDDPKNRFYKGFGMNGERYYTFAVRDVRFFVLDTNMLDPAQIEWFEGALSTATERWKICYFHHPLYSNAGRHGSDVEVRVVLEPLMVQHRVNAVFAGHDHAYERITPQKGITYFVQGASGQLRKGDINRNPTTAAYFDQDRSFTVVEIGAEQMVFQTISRTGDVVDSGMVQRRSGT
jgi:3',5'-cyclic AMP phosphodiesterase CpdA